MKLLSFLLTSLAQLQAQCERKLTFAVEVVAGILVATEIIVLFAGILSRFVWHHPLVWTDELASILFIWLAMLGAVIALARGRHMRMTAIVNLMPKQWRDFVNVLALGLVALFLILILPSALQYAADESFIETPALGWPNSLRASALPISCAIMLMFCLGQMSRLNMRHVLGVALFLAVTSLALHSGHYVFKPLGNINLFVFFFVLLGSAILLGTPIAFAFATATLGYLAAATSAPLSVLVSRIDEGMSSMVLLAVPLFVFLGAVIEANGMAKTMVNCLASLLGHVKGGLNYVLIGAMILVSGISGSKAADMAAVAPSLFPEMKRRGISDGEMVALLSATGAMSETIPPSLVLITIGSVTGVSISGLFSAGLVPALVLALLLCCVVWWRSRGTTSLVAPSTRSEIFKSFWVAIPTLILPFVIRFAVTRGIATATEVSTIGIVYALIVGLIFHRAFDWRRLPAMLAETASLSGAILLIIGAANAMGWALTQSGFSKELAALMIRAPGGAWGFLGVSILGFMVLGSVLEGIPAIVLFGPLLFPAAHLAGVNELHYAVVVVLAMGIGLFAPPLGVGYYAACAIGKINPDKGMGSIVPYFIALIFGLLIVTFVPWLSLGFG